MDLKRKDNEPAFAYKLRLCQAKINKEIDLDWAEIVELLVKEKVLDEPISGDHQRKLGYGYQEYDNYIRTQNSALLNKSELSSLEDKKIEVQKERYKLMDQRNALNRIIRSRSRQEELNDIIATAISKSELPMLSYRDSYDTSDLSDETMLISLNDIHYGANISNSFCVYNSQICAQMMVRYLDQIKIIQDRHQVKECVVWVNGDMIHGAIHSGVKAETQENLIEQVMGVAELIAQFLSELSELFNTVRFVAVSGNHSRLSTQSDSLKDERLDDFVEWWLKARLQNYTNIIFNDYHKVDETLYSIKIRGLNYLGCHGDYDSTPSKIQALSSMYIAQYKEPVYCVLMGHLHHNHTNSVNGVKVLMGGSFLGIDGFCVTQRIYGTPEQLVTICNDKGIVCNYEIDLKVN